MRPESIECTRGWQHIGDPLLPLPRARVATQRAAVLGNKMQREVQSGLAAFLKANPKRNELVNARGEIRLEVCVGAGWVGGGGNWGNWGIAAQQGCGCVWVGVVGGIALVEPKSSSRLNDARATRLHAHRPSKEPITAPSPFLTTPPPRGPLGKCAATRRSPASEMARVAPDVDCTFVQALQGLYGRVGSAPHAAARATLLRLLRICPRS